MPARTIEDRNQQETKYTSQEEAHGGVMLWCAFNTLIISSTRCELGAAFVSMPKGVALRIGIDNAAVVSIGAKIIGNANTQYGF